MFPKSKDIDRTVNPPAKQTGYGAAWEIDHDAYRKRHGLDAKADGAVSSWVVFAPWAHAMWSYYFIGMIHLRPLEGKPPAKIYRPGATHEIMVYALNPEKVPDLFSIPSCLLIPANFVGQFIESCDEQAEARTHTIVNSILSGNLSPDTDFRWQWIKMFGDSCLKR